MAMSDEDIINRMLEGVKKILEAEAAKNLEKQKEHFKEKSAIENYVHSPQYEKDCMSEQKFIKHIRMERNNFYKEKKAGKFDNGIHPATKGTKRAKYNKFYNHISQEIELPPIYKIQFKA